MNLILRLVFLFSPALASQDRFGRSDDSPANPDDQPFVLTEEEVQDMAMHDIEYNWHPPVSDELPGPSQPWHDPFNPTAPEAVDPMDTRPADYHDPFGPYDSGYDEGENWRPRSSRSRNKPSSQSKARKQSMNS